MQDENIIEYLNEDEENVIPKINVSSTNAYHNNLTQELFNKDANKVPKNYCNSEQPCTSQAEKILKEKVSSVNNGNPSTEDSANKESLL